MRSCWRTSARVQPARLKAGLAANRELVALYWDLGRLILERQRREGWGATRQHWNSSAAWRV